MMTWCCWLAAGEWTHCTWPENSNCTVTLSCCFGHNVVLPVDHLIFYYDYSIRTISPCTFYFMYSLAVCQKRISINQLTKELKQLDDSMHACAHAHTYTPPSLTLFFPFCLCVCVCVYCLKYSSFCGQSDLGNTLNYQYHEPI